MGLLERHLDLDVIRRMKAGIKHEKKSLKKVSEPRPASDYRAARKANKRHGIEWRKALPSRRLHFSDVRPNRSRRLDGEPRINFRTE